MKLVKLFETAHMPVEVWDDIREIIVKDGLLTYSVGYFAADCDEPTERVADAWMISQGAEWGEQVVVAHGHFWSRWEEFDPWTAEKAAQSKKE